MAQLTGKEICANPSRNVVILLTARLAELDAQRQAFLKQGDAMVARFRKLYPDAPASLVRYSDRTNNDYRWRLSSAKRWRQDRPAGLNRSFDLTNETGQALLAEQSGEVRYDFLKFENERISLNFQSALVNYERFRVKDLIKRKDALRQMYFRNHDKNRA